VSLKLVLLKIEKHGDMFLAGTPAQRDWLKKSGFLRSTKSWCGA
jgi:hypothetical protein